MVSIKESNLTAVVDMTPVMSVTVSEPALTNYLSSFGSCLGHPGHHLFNCFTRGTKLFSLVRVRGLEPPRIAALGPKPSVSTIPPYSHNYGAATKIRTRDLLITNQLLYQLSYCGLSFYSATRTKITMS